VISCRYHKFYPNGSPPDGDATFSRLISVGAYKRVSSYLESTKGTIVVGGETDESQRYIAPTIVKDVKGDDSLMVE
jgi:aldehyde dehydrogenase (NAD+)